MTVKTKQVRSQGHPQNSREASLQNLYNILNAVPGPCQGLISESKACGTRAGGRPFQRGMESLC